VGGVTGGGEISGPLRLEVAASDETDAVGELVGLQAVARTAAPSRATAARSTGE
jgi:hypothetical protein